MHSEQSKETLPTAYENEADSSMLVERVLLNGETIRCYGDDFDGCTTWESANGVSVLKPDWEKYARHAERVVLDWDDTCKDSGKFWIQAHREVLLDFDFSDTETTDDAILTLFGNIHVGNTLGIERFTKDDKQHSDDEVWGMIKTRARELLAEHPMDPLLIEAIHRAKAMGVRLAVWSSSPREILTETIAANELEDVFDAVVSVDDVDPGKHKPHPQGFLMAVKAMDEARGYLNPDEEYSDEKPFNPNGTWMVGDSPNDVLGGKTAGASTVWLEHPLQGHNAHEKREKTISRVKESLGATALRETLSDTVDELRPTLVIRTFDPEEAGLSRNTSLMDIPAETARGLTTVNINFVKFLIDRNLRSEAYRWEHVRHELDSQGIKYSTGSDDTVAAALYGGTIGVRRSFPPREVWQAHSADEAKKSLDTIAAKLQQDVIL